MFDYPLLFVPQVLGNYSLTKETSRSQDRATWSSIQILLGGSFFKYVPVGEDTLLDIWFEVRSQPVRSTGTLFFIALIYPECRKLLNYANFKDWIFFIASLLKRPLLSYQTVKLVNAHHEIWSFLEKNTALKVKNAQMHGFELI